MDKPEVRSERDELQRSEDEKWMREALRRARTAAARDEVPVGAVIVREGRLLASGYNLRESRQDATLHAEMIAIRRACRKLGSFRLEGCTLYVTLEPCAMCCGAIINARLERVVFGAGDPKGGCCGSLYDLPEDRRFNHRARVEGGILGEECGSLLTSYFRQKRGKQT